jgi:phosphoglycolate phosphatase-like HAD superfamily hydrolase
MTQSRFNAFFLSLVRSRHRGVATLAALGLAIAVAGCGGGGDRLSKSQYQEHLNSDSESISRAVKPLITPPRTMEELASRLKVGEKELNNAADDLDGLKVPSNAAKSNDTLVQGLRTFANELDAFRKAAEKNDPQLLQKSYTELQQSHALVDVREASADLKKKGYKLGVLAQ